MLLHTHIHTHKNQLISLQITLKKKNKKHHEINIRSKELHSREAMIHASVNWSLTFQSTCSNRYIYICIYAFQNLQIKTIFLSYI